MDVEFNGYWSEKDKEIWTNTDWDARDYNYLAVEEDTFEGLGYFYGIDGQHKTNITFVKYINPNPIYPPFYGPVYTSDLLEYMKQGSYCYPMYNGTYHGPYKVHDRFEAAPN